MDIYDRLAQILASEYNIAAEKLLPEARLEDLGIDSLGVMELVFKIEDEFGIQVPSDQTALVTVGDVASYVKCLVENQAPSMASQQAGT